MSFGADVAQLKTVMEKALDAKAEAEVNANVIPLLNDALGGVDGLARALKTDGDRGLPTSDNLEQRQQAFGKNQLPEPEMKSIWALMWEALHDPTLIVLGFSAALSIGIGLGLECKKTGWIEGTAIVVAIIVVVLVSAINDYQKERQFRALNAVKDDVPVNVIRNSEQVQVSIHDVNVGDIVLLSTGNKICADGIFLTGNDLKVDESTLTGETDFMRKGPYSFAGGRVRQNPFFFSGTQVMEGTGRMLVVAVGVNSYSGASVMLMQSEEGEDSVLQKKLNAMATFIGKAGLVIAGLTLLALLIRFGVGFAVKAEGKLVWDNSVHWNEMVRFLIVAITVLVVAVPEGLPLAVTISLAFSVKKMMADNNLVRHLDACETMGSATTICSDKTGTLTTNRMTVMKGFIAGIDFDRNGSALLPQEVIPFLHDSIVYNCDAATQLRPALVGNKTECALLQLVEETKGDYQELRHRRAAEWGKKHEFTFSSARKRMTTIMPFGDKWRIMTKGASEIVVDLCGTMLNRYGAVAPLTDEYKRYVKEKVIPGYASEGLRTLSIAYKDVDDKPDYEDSAAVEHDLVLVAVVGIEDPVRPEVPHAIELCKKAGIVVRMVTGDNIITAKSIARKCGILSPTDENLLAMEGPDFRARVCDADGNINQDAFDKIWPWLRVLARSSPKDKYILVSGIRNSTVLPQAQVVAVTGDGTNDGPALKKADVGFAMNSGTDVAKEASDIILMDDNFNSIVSAVKWGRCVYDNICKFLQFQLTVNLVAVIVAFIGSAILTDSPLKAIQLLWVNLLMDSLASLALATDPPVDALLDRQPYGRDKPLLSKEMVRNIVAAAVYQIIVIMVLIFRGDTLFGIPSGRPADDHSVVQSSDPCDHVKQPTQHFTIVFNAFVFMQLFNEVNSRKIHSEPNMFSGFFSNAYFTVILFVTAGVQVALVEASGVAFDCAPLAWNQWLACILIGFGMIPFYFIVRFIPAGWIPNGEGKAAAKTLPRLDSTLKRDIEMTVMGGRKKSFHAFSDANANVAGLEVGEVPQMAQTASFYRGQRRMSRSLSTYRAMGRVSSAIDIPEVEIAAV